MSSLPTQPLQVNDFSGGITDNFIGGGPTRYLEGDNLLVTVDRKLEERFGSVILDSTNYQLPSGTSPVNALIPHDNESFLIGVNCPNLYIKNPNWTGILGPIGNPPLAGGNYMNSISWGEWSHHTIITNDSLASTPIKIYRGAGYPTTATQTPAGISNFMAVTAGLPKIAVDATVGTAATLAACILLANDLRFNISAHIEDHGAGLNTNLHKALDSASDVWFTGSTPATDLPSLLALIGRMNSGYESHVTDVIANFASSTYHWNDSFSSAAAPPLNYHLINQGTPTTLAQAVEYLNDLKTKFLLHQMAPTTHASACQYSVMGRYLVTSPAVAVLSGGPLLVPSYTATLAFVNAIKAKYNSHEGSTSLHISGLNVGTDIEGIDYPDATTLDDLYVLTSHCRWNYAQHYRDSTYAHSTSTITTTSGSKSITSGTDTPNIIANGFTAWDIGFTIFPRGTTVSSVAGNWGTGSGTATASQNSTHTGATGVVDFTQSKKHTAQNTNTANEHLPSNNNEYILPLPGIQYLSAWFASINQFSTYFNAHNQDSAIHLVQAATSTNFYSTTPTLGTYAYAMHYFYQYMRYDGVIFDVVGPPILLGPITSEGPSPFYFALDSVTNAQVAVPAVVLAVTNIPSLANSGQSNYDTANIQIKIFRTINAGSTYYEAGIISNGTTIFADPMPDTQVSAVPDAPYLIEQETIYTSGGVVNFDPAPVCKYVHVLNNTAYYGAIIDTGQTFLNRIRQSIQNNIDSSPGSFFVDVPDILMGISSTRNNLIAFCANSTFLVTGLFTETGQGQMSYQSISDTIGCVASKSIVRTDVGIFFAGTDGFYYTDGFQLIKLSSEFNTTYQDLVSNAEQKSTMYGAYDRYNRRVWWSTQPHASDSSPSESYIFHVNFGVTAQGAFTTASNFENYRPTAMIFFQGQQIRGDARGYVFLHTPLTKTDPVVNTAVAATSWNTSYIPYNYTSCSLDFGTTFQRKFLTRFSFQGTNKGNIAAQVISISDNGRVPPLACAPILAGGNLMWGNPSIIWGAPNSLQPIMWGSTPQIDVWRRFPATQLRADYKQVSITPAKVGVYRYQDWPVGAGALLLPQGGGICNAQLTTPPGFTALIWPLDCVGYTFATQLDGFIQEYTITGITTTTNAGDTLVLSDPTNSLEKIGVAWIIRGILKEQRISLTSYNIHFTLLGKMNRSYRGSQDAGENAPGTGYSAGHIVDEGGETITDENGNEFIPE